MAEFLVKMADERGRVLQQVENAQSEGELRERFSQQGFLVYSVRPRGILSGGVGLRRGRIKADQFVIFNQQFLTLLRAGVPILHGLELLTKRQRNAYFRSILENVHTRVKGGELLSEAFAAQGVLPRIYTTTLAAGEKSGNLEEVLGRYVHFQRLLLSFRKKLISSLIYPALLVTTMIGVLAVLFTFVIPRFAELFADLNRPLPAITLLVISVADVIRRIAIIAVPALIIVWLLRKRLTKSGAGGGLIDRLRMRLPLFGSVWLKYQVSVFARTMSTLLSGGLPLVPALETAGQSITSRVMASAVTAATRRVREGQPLARSLQEQNVMPELSVEMIEVGESTGALPAMLTSVAELYEEDVQNSLSAAMSLIEPVILLIMGTVVAFILIALYWPIFTLGAGAR